MSEGNPVKKLIDAYREGVEDLGLDAPESEAHKVVGCAVAIARRQPVDWGVITYGGPKALKDCGKCEKCPIEGDDVRRAICTVYVLKPAVEIAYSR